MTRIAFAVWIAQNVEALPLNLSGGSELKEIT
jgi:hypothetical protein